MHRQLVFLHKGLDNLLHLPSNSREAKLQALALHFLLDVGYLLPTIVLSLLEVRVSLVSRLLLFDPVLNPSAGKALSTAW
jgi:hypothetical protein